MRSRLREDALSIFQAALKAADPIQAVLRNVRVEGDLLITGKTRYRLGDVDAIRVVGAGKASASMAQAVERLLGRRIVSGGSMSSTVMERIYGASR